MESLETICSYRNEKASAASITTEDLYVSTESMGPNRGGVSRAASVPSEGKVSCFRKGDTLVSNIRPYFKKIWNADLDGCCSNDVLVFQPGQRCSADYLYWLLCDDAFFDYVMATSKGTKMPRGDKSAIMSYVIPSNSEMAQRNITSILNPIQAKIEMNAKLNGYLGELVTVASKKLYWEYETSGTNLPAGWQWVHIEDIAKLVSRGIAPKYNEHSNEIVLGQTCIRGNLVLVENGRRHCPKRINEKWLQRGDLLINSTGVGSLGRTAQVWFDPEKLTVDSHITIVRTSNSEHALYLGFWAFAHERYIEALHTGSTGQTELPRDNVKSMSLVLPDAETLDRFNTIAKPAVKAIVANQAENKQLSALRDALLPRLMSGEIDVSRVDLTQLNSHLSGC